MSYFGGRISEAVVGCGETGKNPPPKFLAIFNYLFPIQFLYTTRVYSTRCHEELQFSDEVKRKLFDLQQKALQPLPEKIWRR